MLSPIFISIFLFPSFYSFSVGERGIGDKDKVGYRVGRKGGYLLEVFFPCFPSFLSYHLFPAFVSSLLTFLAMFFYFLDIFFT